MILFAQSGTTTMVVLGMLMLIVAWLLFRSKRYYSRVQRQSAAPIRTSRGEKERTPRHLAAPDEVIRWEVEMHDLARELSGTLDSRMGALEQLIRDSDRAAARLEAALGAVNELPDPGPGSSGRGRAGAADMAPDGCGQPTPPSQADALKAVKGTAERDDAPVVGSDVALAKTSGGHDRYQEIYILADYGYAAAEIANRLGTPVGEVELILGLRPER